MKDHAKGDFFTPRKGNASTDKNKIKQNVFSCDELIKIHWEAQNIEFYLK